MGPIFFVLVAMSPVMVMAQGATSRPVGVFPGLDRLSNALDSMDLSDDQKNQIQTMMDSAKEKILQLRRDGQISQARQVLQEIRAQLASILTPAELGELRQKMQQSAPERTGPAPALPPAAQQANPTPEKADTESTEAATKLVEVGQMSPDFRLSRMDGSFVTLASLKGRVVVLVFGSYSSPMLRDRAAGLNQLTLGVETKADVYLVYTKEMHPVGGWSSDRNDLDHVSVQEAKTMDEKEAAARRCRAALRLNMPVLVDDLDDSAATAFGTFPDGAVVINRDGTIVESQQWAEPTALRRVVDQAAAVKLHPSEPQ
jgi:hypothetical protein